MLRYSARERPPVQGVPPQRQLGKVIPRRAANLLTVMGANAEPRRVFSRLPEADWKRLKAAIDAKGLRIVALDLPTSHQGMKATAGDEFTNRMLLRSTA